MDILRSQVRNNSKQYKTIPKYVLLNHEDNPPSGCPTGIVQFRHKIITISLIILTFTMVQAQDHSAFSHSTSITGKNQFWGNIGFGFVSSPNFPGTGMNIDFSYLHTVGLFTIRFMQSSYFGARPAIIQPKFSVDEIKETGVLFGRSFKRKYAFISLSGGMGYIWGIKKRNVDRKKFTSIGVPLEIQLFITPIPFYGVGVVLSSNLNHIQPIIGTFICFQFGLLR